MKTYDKQKLHEYAKELFALCLEKGLDFKYDSRRGSIYIMKNPCIIFKTYVSNDVSSTPPIWELIEKVKAL